MFFGGGFVLATPQAAFHSMRDHPNQNRPFNGGMWGALGKRLRAPLQPARVRRTALSGPPQSAAVVANGSDWNMASLVREWAAKEAYASDLDFLSQQVRQRRAPKTCATDKSEQ